MAHINKVHEAHMKSAWNYAPLSSCLRRKVGCIFVKGDNIISIGYNGTPKGWDNCCEDENNVSHPHVIHAEENAIHKLLNSGETPEGSYVYLTASPCLPCAKLLAGARVSKVFYGEEYRLTDGLDYLNKHGIETVFFPVDIVKTDKDCVPCNKIRNYFRKMFHLFLGGV